MGDELKVHPLFDVVNAEWYCEELDVCAPSLRELRALLPPRTLILGYHPTGFPDAALHRRPAKKASMDLEKANQLLDEARKRRRYREILF